MNSLTILVTLSLGLATALPAQNTNEDAPRATHKIEFGGDPQDLGGADVVMPLSLSISYQQLSLAGGQSLKSLTAKGPRGAAYRKFYNEQYLPNFLKGKLTTQQAMTLQGKEVPAGSYSFTFRIDDDLNWHLVVSEGDAETCSVALDPAKQLRVTSSRLTIEPVATSDEQAKGYFEVRYGPLFARLPFAVSAANKAIEANKPGKDAGQDQPPLRP